MAFDLSTAKPIDVKKFDISTAKPIEEPGSASLGDIARSALQGLTFGASDELGSAAAAGMAYIDESLGGMPETGRSYGEIYSDIMESEQGKMEKFREEHPKTALASEIAGGLATGGIGAAKLAGLRGIRALSPIKQASVIGATEGAAYGALSGKPGERGESAAIGAASGGVGAPVLTAAGRVAAPIVRPVASRIRNAILGDPGSDARTYLATGLAREGIESIEQATPQTSSGGMATLADISESARGMLEGLVSDPEGKQVRRLARELLTERNRGQQSRIFDMIDEGINTVGRTFRETVNGLKRVRQNTAGPLYAEARRKPVSQTPYMKAVMDPETGVPEVLDALKRAERNLATRRATGKQVGNIDLYDEMKRELYDKIQSLYRKGKKNRASDLTKVKNKIIEDVDRQVPEYKAARNSFAGDSELINAAEEGTKILRSDVDYLDDLLRDMGDSEKGMFRVGAKKAIREKLMQAREGTNSIIRITSELNLDKIKRAFPTKEAFNKFKDDLRFEAKIFETERVLHNSMTALRQAERRALDNGVEFKMPESVANDAYGLASKAINRLMNKKLSEEARVELGRMILTPLNELPQNVVQRINSRLIENLPESQRPLFMQMIEGARNAARAAAITAPAIAPSVGQ